MRIQVESVEGALSERIEVRVKLRSATKDVFVGESADFVVTFHTHLFDVIKVDVFRATSPITKKHLGRGRLDFSQMPDWHFGKYKVEVDLGGRKKGRRKNTLMKDNNHHQQQQQMSVLLSIAFEPLVSESELLSLQMDPSVLEGEAGLTEAELQNLFLQRANLETALSDEYDEEEDIESDSVDTHSDSRSREHYTQQNPPLHIPRSISPEKVTDLTDIHGSPAVTIQTLPSTRSHFIQPANFHQVYNSVMSPSSSASWEGGLATSPYRQGSVETATSPTRTNTAPLESGGNIAKRSSILDMLRISSFPILRKSSEHVGSSTVTSPTPQDAILPQTQAFSTSPTPTTSIPSTPTPSTPLPGTTQTLPKSKSLTLPKLRNPLIKPETHLNLEEVKSLTKSFFKTNFDMPLPRLLKTLSFLYKFENGEPIPRTGEFVKDVEVLKGARRFMDYSLVAYGAVMSSFCTPEAISPMKGLRPRADERTAAEYLGIPDDAILYWDHSKRSLSSTRYFIAWDAGLKAVVVSVQGTMSGSQVVTDLNAEYFPFGEGAAHVGMLRAAQGIVDLHFGEVKGWIEGFGAGAVYCTGHSLGAGVAVLVAMLLEERKEELFEGREGVVKASVFACPGVVTRPLAERCVGFVDTYIMENDIVPRISYGTMYAFKEMLLEAADIMDEKMDEDEAFTILETKRAEILVKHSDKLGMCPGTIYHIYKTVRKIPRRHYTRHGIEKQPLFQEAFQTMPLPASEKPEVPHYVLEKGKAEHFQYLAPRRHLLNHHMPWQYLKCVRGALEWLEKEGENGAE
ncbi:hypothetical protein BCR33DRAFT_714958 [Rhizoclosmatium globosum]|uniref:sn-1-specific diacylglycerol lipase n=1 Tax=Rhizoclosmatium globosum TaxID=329046 RepID=A0A1Y2CLM6_9FUNG|nr:hypothetical protein BCR33DRAFT_714958 [Rhizoclosmatium globosum]|eukprot:ORY47910.1 hypothetical protein BCR33DRAFT_714958 [Rhizoclosmatium globosum]